MPKNHKFCQEKAEKKRSVPSSVKLANYEHSYEKNFTIIALSISVGYSVLILA